MPAFTIRHTWGDIIIQNQNPEMCARMRQAIAKQLPEELCCPVTDLRAQFLRERAVTVSSVALPYAHPGPVTIESCRTTAGISDHEGKVLNGIIAALASLLKRGPRPL